MRQVARCAGFTILELLTVVVMIAIIAAVVVPATGGLDSVRLVHAAEATEESLEHARSVAIATGRPTGVSFDLENATIALVRVEPGEDAPARLAGPMGTPLESISLAGRYATSVASVSASENMGDAIWFRFDGTPERRNETGDLLGLLEGEATVELVKGDDTLTIVVHGASGLVEVGTP